MLFHGSNLGHRLGGIKSGHNAPQRGRGAFNLGRADHENDTVIDSTLGERFVDLRRNLLRQPKMMNVGNDSYNRQPWGRPSASSPGRYCRANSWLTMTAGTGL